MAARPSKRSRVMDDADDDDDSSFTFKYNEEGELVGTAEEEAADRAYLASLKEVDREDVLLQREYERNNAKKMWEFKQKKLESAAATASSARRRGAGDAKQKKALEKLQANRKRQKARSTKQNDDDEDEFDDMEEDEADELEDDLDDDDEYDDDAPSRSSSRSGRGRKGRRRSAHDDDDDDDLEAVDEDEDAAEATLDEIQQIRLSRHKLEKWCHEPFFDELVEGCFVRIGIGTSNETGKSVYRCAEIVQIEDRQPYTVGKTKTRKALKLRHGDQERNFRMEFVSNSDIELSEFRKWREAMLDNDLRPATRGHVERKLKALEEAKNFEHRPDHVRKIVEEKLRAGASVGNSTVRVSNLDMQIASKDVMLEEMAAEGRDPEEMGRVYEERKALINERESIKRKAVELRQDRQASYSRINEVNERNRKANLTAKKAQKKIDPESERRTKAPMVVSLQATPKKTDTVAEEEAAKAAAEKAAQEAEAARLSKPRRDSAQELRQAHESVSVDIDVALPLDFDIPILPPVAPAAATKTPVRKGLGFLAAYKQTNGLI